MNKSQSIRRKISVLLCIVVTFQSLTLIISLFSTELFEKLDAESVKVFDNITETRAHTFNVSTSILTNNVMGETEALTDIYENLSNEANISQKYFYSNTELYNSDVLSYASETILKILEQNYVTGAYVLFNTSTEENNDIYSGIYIKDNIPELFNKKNTTLEIGTDEIADTYALPKSQNMKSSISSNNGYTDFSFYYEPTDMATNHKFSELSNYGFWATPSMILNSEHEIVSYSLPLIDENGDAYGVVGIELEVDYLSNYNLPYSDLLFTDSFCTLSLIENDSLDLGWYISVGSLAPTYLSDSTKLELHTVPNSPLYNAYLNNGDVINVSVSEILLYEPSSYFYGPKWALTYYIPNNIIQDNSTIVRNRFIGSIILSTLLAFVVIYVLVSISTRKIVGLSKYIKNLSPNDEMIFENTGLSEIDDLISAVSTLSKNLISSIDVTSKILELSLLPIGGYEIKNKSDRVIITEFLYDFLNIDKHRVLSLKEWNQYLYKLTENPYKKIKDIYRYTNPSTNVVHWLRIIQTTSETGYIGIVLDVTDDINENIRLTDQLDYDNLTKLFSQTAFKRYANERIKENPNSVGAMIFIDIDNLKYVNDNFGHEWGDKLLIQASLVFRFFEDYNGIISRISGDEFCIYLHDFKSKDEIREISNNLHSYSKSFDLQTPDGISNEIRFSTGIAWYPDDADNVYELLRLSDFAMYEAKKKEKGQIFEFNKSYYDEMSYLLENRVNISKLLDEELIQFAFQPIVDLQTAEIHAYEALMRSLMPCFTSPLEIISVATSQSKLIQLEKLIMKLAFKTISSNIDIIGNRKIFVNSIPNESVSLREFTLVLKEFKQYFENLVIEIIETESGNEKILKKKVDTLRSLGIKIAIDDFGNGYSNELRILNLSPDIIKIDMGLIQGIHSNLDKQTFVSNLVRFSHSKGILVVAEGIENSNDLQKVIELGIDFAQGYYLARPSFAFDSIPNRIKNEILEIRKSL